MDKIDCPVICHSDHEDAQVVIEKLRVKNAFRDHDDYRTR